MASPPVLFESSYGSFQTRYLWFIPVLGVIGLVGVPLGIFWNEGWEMGNRPMEPWAAMMIIEIIAVGALATAGILAVAQQMRRKSPQRVAITPSALIVPSGMFSRTELVLPFAEIKLRVFHAGFVKQLQIMHGRRKILLSSALFPSDADFDSFVDCLPR